MIKETTHFNSADYAFVYEFELDNLEEFSEVISIVKKRHHNLGIPNKINVIFNIFDITPPKLHIKITTPDG